MIKWMKLLPKPEFIPAVLKKTYLILIEHTVITPSQPWAGLSEKMVITASVPQFYCRRFSFLLSTGSEVAATENLQD